MKRWFFSASFFFPAQKDLIEKHATALYTSCILNFLTLFLSRLYICDVMSFPRNA